MLHAFFSPRRWRWDHRQKLFHDMLSEDVLRRRWLLVFRRVSGDGAAKSPASIQDILFGGRPVSLRPSPGGLRPGMATRQKCSAATISCLLGMSTWLPEWTFLQYVRSYEESGQFWSRLGHVWVGILLWPVQSCRKLIDSENIDKTGIFMDIMDIIDKSGIYR